MIRKEEVAAENEESGLKSSTDQEKSFADIIKKAERLDVNEGEAIGKDKVVM